MMWSTHLLADDRSESSSASSEELGGHGGAPVGAVGRLRDRPAPGRQRAYAGLQQRVIGAERLADRGLGRAVGDAQRRLDECAGTPRLHLLEAHQRVVARLLAMAVEQLLDLGRGPGVGDQAAPVVVDRGDDRVRVGAVVGEHAHDDVLVAVHVARDVALARGRRPHAVGPAGALDPGVDQFDGGALGLGGLARGAEAGDPEEQRERGRGARACGVGDQALPEDLFEVVGPEALAPPGAEHLADHHFGVERAAYGEQFAGGVQHVLEHRVRRWSPLSPGM
jgi:hypothetical protein